MLITPAALWERPPANYRIYLFSLLGFPYNWYNWQMQRLGKADEPAKRTQIVCKDNQNSIQINLTPKKPNKARY